MSRYTQTLSVTVYPMSIKPYIKHILNKNKCHNVRLINVLKSQRITERIYIQVRFSFYNGLTKIIVLHRLMSCFMPQPYGMSARVTEQSDFNLVSGLREGMEKTEEVGEGMEERASLSRAESRET